MATCRRCKSKTTLTLRPTDRFVDAGPAYVAGVQTKRSVTPEYLLACDPDVDGCGWSVRGWLEDPVIGSGGTMVGGHFVGDRD